MLGNKVNDKESFIRFLYHFKENHKNWENNTLSSFLEALVAYTEDIEGYYANTNQTVSTKEPSWQLFADILQGATMYE
jgi:hypothetical protein